MDKKGTIETVLYQPYDLVREIQNKRIRKMMDLCQTATLFNQKRSEKKESISHQSGPLRPRVHPSHFEFDTWTNHKTSFENSRCSSI